MRLRVKVWLKKSEAACSRFVEKSINRLVGLGPEMVCRGLMLVAADPKTSKGGRMLPGIHVSRPFPIDENPFDHASDQDSTLLAGEITEDETSIEFDFGMECALSGTPGEPITLPRNQPGAVHTEEQLNDLTVSSLTPDLPVERDSDLQIDSELETLERALAELSKKRSAQKTPHNIIVNAEAPHVLI